MSTDSSATLAGFHALSVGLTVRIAGTSIEAVVGASGSFELKDVPEGNLELQFSGPGVDAKISLEGVSAQERIKLSVKISGSSAVLETTNRQTPDDKVNLKGKIESVDMTSSSFRMSDLVVRVMPETAIRRGPEAVTLMDLRAGDEASVRGLKDGPTVRAEKVDVPSYKTLSGVVSGLAGSCPTITFALDGAPVGTEASTIYTGSACGEVKNGEKRSVSGPKTDGRFTARYVSSGEAVPPKSKEDKPQSAERTLKGYVGSLAGGCPSLTFTVSSTAVTTSVTTGPAATNGSTKVSGGACGDIKNGVKVEVQGTAGSDGRVLAHYLYVWVVKPK